MQATIANWSPSQQRWVVTARAEGDGKTVIFTCAPIWSCARGYYDYDAGYMPNFSGIDQYTGNVIHPQHWPANVELDGRRIVVSAAAPRQ